MARVAVQQHFMKFDEDGNGSISIQELGQVLLALDPSLTQIDIDALTHAADTNKDGSIQYEEFLKWVMQEEDGNSLLSLLDSDMACAIAPFRVGAERRSLSGVPVTVQLKNDLSFQVNMSWINGKGKAASGGEVIPAGEEFGMETNSKHCFVIESESDGKELACVNFTRIGGIKLSDIVSATEVLEMVELAPERKSGWDPEGDITVDVLNDTTHAITPRWLSYEGSPEGDDVYPPGETWYMGSNTAHPFSISIAEGGPELACILFKKSGNVKISAIVNALGGLQFALAAISCAKKARRNKLHTIFYRPLEEDLSRWTEDELWWACRNGEVNCPTNGIYFGTEVAGFTWFLQADQEEKYPDLRDRLSRWVTEFERVLPPHATALLRERTAIFVNTNPDENGGVCHWCRGWLSDNGYAPEKEHCVEMKNIDNFVDCMKGDYTNLLLHELAHCYHCHRVSAGDGWVDEAIQDAYAKAMATGAYDEGKHESMGYRLAFGTKPYSATNHFEYFAELSCAFFSSSYLVCNFFPYLHCELKRFDPYGYDMCEKVWQVDGNNVPSRGELPQQWLRDFGKVKADDLKEEFKKACAGTRTLTPHAFAAAVCHVVPRLGPEEARAASTLADADRSGQVDCEEFVAWLITQIGDQAEAE